jgi:tetratricopeptide (TPR) repeat protein
MSSKKPIVRQTAWVSLLPHLILLALLMYVFSLFIQSFNMAVLSASASYLVISFTLRYTIPRNHRRGIVLFKADKYPQAIEEYKKSYEFFRKHAWIDKYRFITLLSSSRISYTEMALNNIAYCYAQTGNAELAKQYYQKTLDLFPDSALAKSALNMIQVFEKK